jgi:hypothetical protein
VAVRRLLVMLCVCAVALTGVLVAGCKSKAAAAGGAEAAVPADAKAKMEANYSKGGVTTGKATGAPTAAAATKSTPSTPSTPAGK